MWLDSIHQIARFVLIAAVPIAALSGAEATDDFASQAVKIDALFADWNKPEMPGCAVGVVREGRLVYGKGFGSANLDYGVPNSTTTIFEIGSFSKAFTSLAVAILLDEGKLAADDDVRRFVPEMHTFNPPIRIRDLLRCHTGIWDPWHALVLAGWENLPIHSPYAKSDVLTLLSGQKKLPFEPGSTFHYGSGDYFLLALIVERASGQTLAEFCRTRIFAPLRMDRTFVEVDPAQVVQQRAVGHIKVRNGPWRNWTNHGYLPGGGGVKTSIDDLVRWDRAFDSHAIAAAEHVARFFQEGSVLDNRFCLDADAYVKKTNPENKSPAGQYRGLKRIQFTGGVFGMAAGMARFPDQKFTVFCLANTDGLAPWRKAEDIADVCLADKFEPAPVSAQPPERREVRVDANELSDKVGSYLAEGGILFEVTFRDGKLWNTNPRGETYELKPLGSDRFLPTFYPEDTFVFERSSPGQPFELRLDASGGPLPFRRVTLVDPQSIALADYAGEYFSEELAATYRFKVEEDALWLRVNSRRWERLRPTLHDEFIPYVRSDHENRRIVFRRDETKGIAGFTISFWRVKGIEFEKR